MFKEQGGKAPEGSYAYLSTVFDRYHKLWQRELRMYTPQEDAAISIDWEKDCNIGGSCMDLTLSQFYKTGSGGSRFYHAHITRSDLLDTLEGDNNGIAADKPNLGIAQVMVETERVVVEYEADWAVKTSIKPGGSLESQIKHIGRSWIKRRGEQSHDLAYDLMGQWEEFKSTVSPLASEQRQLLFQHLAKEMGVTSPPFPQETERAGLYSARFLGILDPLLYLPRGSLSWGARVFSAFVLDLSAPSLDEGVALQVEIAKHMEDMSNTARLKHVIPAVDEWLFAS